MKKYEIFEFLSIILGVSIFFCLCNVNLSEHHKDRQFVGYSSYNEDRQPIPDEEKVWKYDQVFVDSYNYTGFPSGEYYIVGKMYDMSDPKDKKLLCSNTEKITISKGKGSGTMEFVTDCYEHEPMSIEYTLYTAEEYER